MSDISHTVPSAKCARPFLAFLPLLADRLRLNFRLLPFSRCITFFVLLDPFVPKYLYPCSPRPLPLPLVDWLAGIGVVAIGCTGAELGAAAGGGV